MNIKTEKINDVVVIRLYGKLVIGEPVEKFRNVLDSLIKEGNKKFVIDLSKVDYMDSTGLGELVRAYTTSANQVIQSAKLIEYKKEDVFVGEIYLDGKLIISKSFIVK